MRVMIAPDSFGDTLTAVDAAAAIAEGWASSRPGDHLVELPRSDGGPGFVDVLATSLPQSVIHTATVSGPLDRPTDARWLQDGSTAYIEAAAACGLHLLGSAPTRESSLRAHSRGVGELVADAIGRGVDSVVVGLGGSSCTDGGRAMIAALGGLDAAIDRLQGIDLVAATDVENPLLGQTGAAAVFGPQKGADASAVAALEDRNVDWSEVLLAVTGTDVAARPGAGAAGGIGAALLALGATRASGAEVVAERTGQDEILSATDLVITGEGKFDSQSLRGKVVTSLAGAAARHGVETIVLAGQVTLSDADIVAAGISSASSIVSFAGSVELAMSDARAQLVGLAAAVARAR